MNPWSWLNANAGALQSIAAMLAVVLTLITIGVLMVTWKAIKVHADAARALKRVAEEQTKAAKAAATAAEVEARLTADQVELSTAPLLVFELGGTQLKNRQPWAGRGDLVQYWQGGFEHLSSPAFGGLLADHCEPFHSRAG